MQSFGLRRSAASSMVPLSHVPPHAVHEVPAHGLGRLGNLIVLQLVYEDDAHVSHWAAPWLEYLSSPRSPQLEHVSSKWLVFASYSPALHWWHEPWTVFEPLKRCPWPHGV